jgi:hypothetical protein
MKRIFTTCELCPVSVGSSFAAPTGSKSDAAADVDAEDTDAPKHEHDDEGHEVEEPIADRFLSWRHFVFTRKMDLLVVCGGYLTYLIVALVIMFGPVPPDVPN